MSSGKNKPFSTASFVLSAYRTSQMPSGNLPEISFAGRSNVGKSSLLNTVLSRKNLVKTSSRPGKTQSINFFLVDDICHFVDLPGYGYAKVSKSLRAQWGSLIETYLRTRKQLRCVVVIIDLRHEPKRFDMELLNWLRLEKRTFLAVYTKADKLSYNKQQQNAAVLDRGHGLAKDQRFIFSAANGQGRDALLATLASLIT
ncbi:MAG TPA: GTP-binding protein [Desulfofustis sp.]|nr:GTP-binding protein [Desulfofustis sp.]